MKHVLEPLWEARFLPCSHGFRPGRSVFTAVVDVLHYATAGLQWVADADIADCFAQIAHAQLMTQLTPTVDVRLAALLAAWLEVGAESAGCGLAQGAVLSPLLANIFLHPVDLGMTGAGYALVRYADDFVVMCADLHDAISALDAAEALLGERGLALNSHKTLVQPFGPEFRFLGAVFEA